jgi:hypothetical protein
MRKRKVLQLPVVSLAAEYLAIGHLLRRNILTYKAPPKNEGYDLICMHPDPRQAHKQVRIQVKSRYQTDCNRIALVKTESLGAFDYLIVVFLNIGYFYSKRPVEEGRLAPEFYTFPQDWVRLHHKSGSGWDKLDTKHLDLSPFKDEKGFNIIAQALEIPYPKRENAPTRQST